MIPIIMKMQPNSTAPHDLLKNKACIVISNPIPATNKSPVVTLGKFVRILDLSYKRQTIICANMDERVLAQSATLLPTKCNREGSKISRILSFAWYELQAAWLVWKASPKSDIAFFWIADKMILPFLAAKIRKIPICYMVAGNISKEGNGSSFGEKLIRFMIRYADYVHGETASVLTEWGVDSTTKKTVCMHLYVETDCRVHSVKEIHDIGMLCRLCSGKHVTDAIEAIARLNKRADMSYRLHVVGDGPQREECENLIKKLGIEDQVSLIGWVENDLIGDLIDGWDLLLFPSDAEGLPNAPLEAMARGVPVLASKVGGLKDVLVDGYNGWFLEGTDPDDILKSIEHVAEADSIVVSTISNNARRTIEGEFSRSNAALKAQAVLKANNLLD